MGIAGTIWSDFRGLRRVCGAGVALKWAAAIAGHLGECRRIRNLQPADRAMGEGPFEARSNGARARMVGRQVISGIREIWVRDVYLHHGYLRIAPDAQVVDLGANMGNFTMLALGHGPGVRVVAVEPLAELRQMLQRQLRENGWEERARVCASFIGGRTEVQEKLLATGDADETFISQDAFLAKYQLDRIDFLKCDIEGSEYELLTDQSPILSRTRQLAMEAHGPSERRQGLIDLLRKHGFETVVPRENPTDCIVLARRR